MKLDRSVLKASMVIVFILFLGVSAIVSVSAQQKQKPQCPVTKVSSPDSVFPKDPLKFIANVSGGDSNVTPTYNWSVSAGSISSGQGTSVIDVDTSEVAGDSTITATVELGGFDRACGYGSTASSSTTSILKKAEARKTDEYGKLMAKDENARLDNFAIELMNDPLTQGYIVVYNGRASRPGDAKTAVNRAKGYLTKKRGLDPGRVMAVDGGYREEPGVELWIVPSGAEPPKASPTVEPPVSKPAASKRATAKGKAKGSKPATTSKKKKP